MQTGKYNASRDNNFECYHKKLFKNCSKTKMKDRSGITLCISYTVNLESINTVYQKTIYIFYIFMKKTHVELLNRHGLDFFLL